MYISGSLSTLQQRLHQLPESGADITAFRAEVAIYDGVVGDYDIVRWYRELDKTETSIS